MKIPIRCLGTTFGVLMVFSSALSTNCYSQEKKFKLELRQYITGNAANTGDILIFRMSNPVDADFDCVKNPRKPFSPSNLFRKTLKLNQTQSQEILHILMGIVDSQIPERFSLDEKASDVGIITTVVISNQELPSKKFSLQGDIGQFSETTVEDFPPKLKLLFTRIIDLKGPVCGEK